MLKTAAARVLARNSACNSSATRKIKPATDSSLGECKKLRDLNHDEINSLLMKLSDIKLYRVEDRLGWRNEPSDEQVQLLALYQEVLLELLKPRAYARTEGSKS